MADRVETHPMWDLISHLEKTKAAAQQPGSETDAARQRSRGKLLARERIDMLLDPGTFHEMDLLVYPESADPAMAGKQRFGDGVIAGWGEVDGRRVFVFSQDPTVVGGSLGEAGGRKIHKLMDLAAEAGAPIVGINDGGGARIQEGVASLAAYGGVFARNARYSGVVPQISLIMGIATGGAVYSPALTDFVFMVEGTAAMSITGPDVVRAATGEHVTFEELGGAHVHGSRSGVAHFVAPDEPTCIAEVRRLLGYLPSCAARGLPIDPTPQGRTRDSRLVEVLPASPTAAYDVRTVIRLVGDSGDFFEVSPTFAPNIVCGFTRIDGRTVGVVANQPAVMSGILDIDSSEKAARFVRTCDAFNVPLLVIVDSPGFRPGVDQEHQGLARRGAKLLYAFCEASVPRIQLVVRRAYGAAYVTMASKATGTHFCFAWPSAELAVMGANAAVQLLHGHDLAVSERPDELTEELIERYHRESINPYRAAAGGFIDEVIDPRDTRSAIADAFRLLEDAERQAPPRKHGNIPL